LALHLRVSLLPGALKRSGCYARILTFFPLLTLSPCPIWHLGAIFLATSLSAFPSLPSRTKHHYPSSRCIPRLSEWFTENPMQCAVAFSSNLTFFSLFPIQFGRNGGLRQRCAPHLQIFPCPSPGRSPILPGQTKNCPLY